MFFYFFFQVQSSPVVMFVHCSKCQFPPDEYSANLVISQLNASLITAYLVTDHLVIAHLMTAHHLVTAHLLNANLLRNRTSTMHM